MFPRAITVARILLVSMASLSSSFAIDTYVSAGQSLQTVLDAAVPGDTITLQAGATFSGSFVLRAKTGTSWITIRSSLMSALPPEGSRVQPSHAPYMARLISPNGGPAITAAPGAHNYRIMGVELASVPGVYSIGVVVIGSGTETQLAEFPYDIELDRVYIHGDPVEGAKRGVAAEFALYNCQEFLYFRHQKHVPG